MHPAPIDVLGRTKTPFPINVPSPMKHGPDIEAPASMMTPGPIHTGPRNWTAPRSWTEPLTRASVQALITIWFPFSRSQGCWASSQGSSQMAERSPVVAMISLIEAGIPRSSSRSKSR